MAVQDVAAYNARVMGVSHIANVTALAVRKALNLPRRFAPEFSHRFAGAGGRRKIHAHPFEPPMPPKVKAQQALKFAESLARGEPNRSKIALTIASDKVRELV